MPKKNSTNLAAVVIGVGVTALAGLGWYAMQPKSNPATQHSENTTAGKIDDIDIQVKPVDKPENVTVLNPEFKGDELTFKSSTKEVPKGEDPKVYALNEYLANVPAVPKSAKALSCKVDKGIATVNFNGDLMAGYGTEDEQMVINGILKTLGAFEDVKAVRILIDGEKAETLGNIEILDPQPVLRP